MDYYNFGYSVPPGGSAFGGFAGGLTQIPGGIIPPPPPSLLAPGPRFIGDELPSVDPFNYPGVIHFGPSYTIIGPHMPDIQPGTGIFDPNLVVPGVPSINMDIPNPFFPM